MTHVSALAGSELDPSNIEIFSHSDLSVGGEGEEATLSMVGLATGDILYSAGDVKRGFYRVETGALSVSRCLASGGSEIVELVFPGNVVGLGFLDNHVETAEAVVDSTVSVWEMSDLPVMLERSPGVRQRLAEATEREFAHHRRILVESTRDKPLHRVAAFLLAVSRLNAREGRDDAMIDHTLSSGVVADYLNLTIDMLGQALAELERRRLVAPMPPHALLIRDPAGLEAMLAGG